MATEIKNDNVVRKNDPTVAKIACFTVGTLSLGKLGPLCLIFPTNNDTNEINVRIIPINARIAGINTFLYTISFSYLYSS